MILQTHTPQQVSLWLALMTGTAVFVILIALAFVGVSLTREFNASAARDAMVRVERGLQVAIETLSTSSKDYSNWTEHYEAILRQDDDWLYQNVGTSAYSGGVTELIILAGGPLDEFLAWSSETADLDQASYQELVDFALGLHELQSYVPGDPPHEAIRWVGDDLWLIAVSPIVPHTVEAEVARPLALQIFGLPLDATARGRFRDVLLVSDLEIGTTADDPRASLALDVSDGTTAWMTWALPQPGTDAMKAVAAPIAVALLLITMVLAMSAVVARRIGRQMDQSRIEAEAANAAKTEFLAHMSHEIRTPLNGVIGMADLLADTPLQKDQRELLETIQMSGAHLLLHVNAILDLAKVEAGKLTLGPVAFSLGAVLDRLNLVHGSVAKSKEIALQVHREPGLVDHRFGDAMRLEQILHNVLGNAVKFTEAGLVTLDVRSDDYSRVVFCITDTGIGMTQPQIDRIFNPFEQADAGTTRRFGGSGLGMAIVRGLVEVMDGTIAVSSVPEEGTTVIITLPLPVADPVPSSDEIEADGPVSVDATAAIPRDIRLLVADDNATNRKIVELMLRKLGCEAHFAENGAEACRMWDAQHFDLVFMDISMPVMDGVVALATMNAAAKKADRPLPVVVAVTANVMKTQVESYKALGFADVLSKPVKREDLNEMLVRHLSAPAGDTPPP